MVVGDELWVSESEENANDGFKIFVSEINPNNDDVFCIHEDGSVASWDGGRDITIIRSGRRNLLSTMVSNMSFKGTDGNTSQGDFNSRNDKVLNTSVATLNNDWEMAECSNYWTYEEETCVPSAAANELNILLNEISTPNFPSNPWLSSNLTSIDVELSIPPYTYNLNGSNNCESVTYSFIPPDPPNPDPHNLAFKICCNNISPAEFCRWLLCNYAS